MKKKLLILGLTLLLLLTACSNNDNGKAKKKDDTAAKTEAITEMPTEPEETFKIGETIINDKIEITITDKIVEKEIVDDSGYWSTKPDSESNSFVIIPLTIKNVSNEAINLDSNSFRILNGDKTYNGTKLLMGDKGLNYTSINPDTIIEKEIYFDLPDDVANLNTLVLKVEDTWASKTGKIEIELNI